MEGESDDESNDLIDEDLAGESQLRQSLEQEAEEVSEVVFDMQPDGTGEEGLDKHQTFAHQVLSTWPCNTPLAHPGLPVGVSAATPRAGEPNALSIPLDSFPRAQARASKQARGASFLRGSGAVSSGP